MLLNPESGLSVVVETGHAPLWDASERARGWPSTWPSHSPQSSARLRISFVMKHLDLCWGKC